MNVSVLGTGGTWWPPMCCFSTNENSSSLETLSGWGSTAHIQGADQGGKEVRLQIPSKQQPGRLCPQQAYRWAGLALIAFSFSCPPVLRRLLFNEENSITQLIAREVPSIRGGTFIFGKQSGTLKPLLLNAGAVELLQQVPTQCAPLWGRGSAACHTAGCCAESLALPAEGLCPTCGPFGMVCPRQSPLDPGAGQRHPESACVTDLGLQTGEDLHPALRKGVQGRGWRCHSSTLASTWPATCLHSPQGHWALL